jgi:hypothetical protein
MTRNNNEFRANATECQRMADATQNPGDKKRWLQMAESWLRMIKAPRQAASARFDSAELATGTQQTKSDASH